MAWFPIDLKVPQYVDSNGDPFSGAVLKAFDAGTSTNTNLATDNTGDTQVGSIALNANGYPEVSSNIVIPHIDSIFKLSLFPTQAAADADTGAIWTIDNINPLTNDKAANVASAATTDIWSATGDFMHITGTTTITAFGTSPQDGLERVLEFDGILTLTDGTNIVLPGNANITTAAGDTCTVRAESSTVAKIVHYTRADGTALIPGVGVNLFYNGNFDIWQRGTTITTSGARVYGSDRFEMSSAQNLTVSRQAGTSTRFLARMQRDSGETVTNPINFAQTLETSDSEHLQSKSVTLSFRAKKGANFSATDDILTSNIAIGTGTDESVLAGLTGQVSQNQNNTLTSSFQTFTHTVTLSADTTEVAVVLSWIPVGTAGAADSFDVEWVKLETGSSPSEFIPKKVAEEQFDCQRYFAKTFASGTAPAEAAGTAGSIVGNSVVTTEPQAFWRYPQEMRTSPTITLFNPISGTTGEWGTGASSSANARTLDNSSAGVTLDNTDITVAFSSARIHVSVDAEL